MISAILLAAGSSSRLGKPKQLINFLHKPLLKRAIETVKRSKVDETVLVLGHRADEILKKVSPTNMTVVINANYAKGLSTSLKLGLRSIDLRSSAALIILADQPFLSSRIINRLIDAYIETKALIVVPTYMGVQVNPVLISRKLFPEVLKVRGDVGAKSVISRHRDRVVELKVSEPRLLLDVDTMKDVTMVRRMIADERETRSFKKARVGEGKAR